MSKGNHENKPEIKPGLFVACRRKCGYVVHPAPRPPCSKSNGHEGVHLCEDCNT